MVGTKYPNHRHSAAESSPVAFFVERMVALRMRKCLTRALMILFLAVPETTHHLRSWRVTLYMPTEIKYQPLMAS